MNRSIILFSVAALAACGPDATPPPQPAPQPTIAVTAPPPPKEDTPSVLPYPKTKRVDAKDVVQGVTIEDPYRWLEDGTAPDVKAWMAAEDDLARAELHKLPERDAIAARLKELFYYDAIGAPFHRGDRYFFTRKHADKEKTIVYFKKGKDGAEKVLFDPNAWSTDGSVGLGAWSVTWDGKNVAYNIHKNNSDEATMYLMDVETQKKSEVDVIEGAKYATASWTPKGDGFYYTWLPKKGAVPESERPGYAEVRFHKVGEDPAKDKVIRERTNDPTMFLGADLSRDGRWLLLTVSHGWSSDDVYFMDLQAKKKEFSPLAVGTKAHFSVEVFKDKFYVKSDLEAPHSRVFVVDPKKPARADWKEIVPERADATLESAGIIGGRLALSYLKNASHRLEVHELDGKLVKEIALPGLGTMGGPYGRSDEDEGYFSYTSFTVPSEIYSFSMKDPKTKLYSSVKVPVDPTPYTVTQEFYPSKDGTKVSMFIVHRKDIKKDGSSRALLTGYGGFLVSVGSTFTGSVYTWLERGGIYAVPNLRGGAEYGEEWHKNGMLLKKQNVFDDFIGAAEFLIKEGYTKPDRLAIYGASNGGLLMGAAMTQRPDLFSAVICAVPLLDMVRYHLSGSGKTWVSEYGSADDPEQFKVLHQYSPYHHIKDGAPYPALLMMSADSDDRVDPMHARKFAAAMQVASHTQPVLLRIERNSGHTGADLVKAEVEKGADRYAFALAHTAH